MKVCFKCNIEKPINDYYKHKQMGDGHLNKCKSCTRIDARKRELIITSTPEGLESERKRHREKYYRLNYKNKHKPTKERKKQAMDNYKDKYPEKIKAVILCQRIDSGGLQKHHWSYQLNHAKDIIPLSNKNHNKIHRFLRYDKKTFMFKDLNGNLLDTKEKHLAYINKVIEL
jgi:hypothetical protein